jgi:hypothetical protein
MRANEILTGNLKVFLTFTPADDGILMSVSTWLDSSCRYSPFKRFIGWVLAGIAASQLELDIQILEKKIKLKKPYNQPKDGPVSKVKSWLNQFQFKKPVTNERENGHDCQNGSNVEW